MDNRELETSQAALQQSLRASLWDGGFATAMASLAGGLFLVGFALNVMHADPVEIGILAALPISANVAQLLGALLLMKFGRRRLLCFGAVTLGRLLWIPVMVLPFVVGDGAGIWLLIGLIGIASLLGSISGVAWLDWMTDLVPGDIRGKFMARRNGIAAASGVAAILAGGEFLTRWQKTHGEDDPSGYLILFGAGVLLGLAASAFLWKVKDPKQGPASSRQQIDWGETIEPVRHANFRWLLLYVGLFMFSTQIAGPFYTVFMLDNLGVSFSQITWMMLAATLATLFMLRIWGPISDRNGNRPVLLVAGALHALIPLAWIVATPESFLLPLFVAHILSGAIFSAITLAHVNILMKLAPVRGRSMAIALFNATIGLATAIAPVTGGWIVTGLGDFSLQAGGVTLTALPLLFLLSGILQIACLPSIAKVSEPAATPAVAVLLQLGNDLNPQTGISSATDFILVQTRRSTGILQSLDAVSDRAAASSEARIGKALDRIWNPFARVIKAAHDILTRDLK